MQGAKKLITAGVATVLVLGIAAICLLVIPAQTPEGSSVTLHSGNAADIEYLTIENTHGNFEVQAKDGGFEVHDIPPMLVDYQMFTSLMYAGANVSAVRKIENTKTSNNFYSGDTPLSTVNITYTNGKELSLQINGQEKVSGGYYFTANGKNDVYLMEGSAAAMFLLPAKAFIEHRVTPPLAASSPLSAVVNATFTGGGLEQPVIVQAASQSPQLKLKALSFGAVTHIATVYGDDYEMDQTYGIEVLDSLLGMPALDIVEYNCTLQQLANYGFNDAWMTVEFDLVNGTQSPLEQYTIKAVPNGNGQYLVTVNNYGIVYLVGEEAFLNIDSSKLIMRWYLSPLIMDLSGLSVTTQGQTLNFELAGEGNNKQVTLNSNYIDIDIFRQFYKLIASAAHNGESINDNTAKEALPALIIEYRYSDEEKEPDIIEFYPAGTRKLLVVVNGNPSQFGMREMYLTRVQQACNAVLNAEEFDVNW